MKSSRIRVKETTSHQNVMPDEIADSYDEERWYGIAKAAYYRYEIMDFESVFGKSVYAIEDWLGAEAKRNY
jgi:hypothetical protein